MMQHTDVLVQGFTRRETLKLTGCTPSRLKYLEKLGLVKPTKVANDGRACNLFSWEQLLELRTIHNLRRQLSLQAICKVVAFLKSCGLDPSLRHKQLVVSEHEVFWVQVNQHREQLQAPILRLSSRKAAYVGQFVLQILPPLCVPSPATSHRLTPVAGHADVQTNVTDLASFRTRLRP